MPAASIRASTSCSVRYSRVRSSALGGRRGVIVRFTVAGAANFSGDFVNVFNSGQNDLSEDDVFYEQSLLAIARYLAPRRLVSTAGAAFFTFAMGWQPGLRLCRG